MKPKLQIFFPIIFIIFLLWHYYLHYINYTYYIDYVHYTKLLCDAVRCRVEDGDATAEDWTDSNGKTLAADRFWNSGIETMIAGDEEGPCLGIQLNIWERAKVIFSCYALLKLCALYLLDTLSSLFSIARQVRRHIVHTYRHIFAH